MSTPVRVRFAPSPTGYLHVGGARTALFNHLFARRSNGTFILRIEDTDRTRFSPEALNEIYTSLKWLGLQWDEGPQAGGAFGPYIQSERLDLYRTNVDHLIKTGHAYRCFCTPQRLDGIRAEQEKNKHPLGYDRHCRNLDADTIQAHLDAKTPFVVRFKIPRGRTVVFNDLIRGEISYQSDVLDDLVLLKTDGFPTYHLANVVDDHHMQISHVLRGDEWIASTPRHVLLYEAFGWTPPVFAHMPVILDPTGGKLSKRKGAASVMDYKKGGILPEALFNFIALLGWAPGDNREKMDRDELIAAFTLENVTPKAAVFDEKKLEWMNGLYLTESTAAALKPAVLDLWNAKGFLAATRPDLNDYADSIINLLKVRSRRITDLADSAAYFFIDPVSYEEKAAKKHFNITAVDIIKSVNDTLSPLTQFDHAAIEKAFHELAATKTVSLGELNHPVRLAISGVSVGPGLFEMMEVIGKQTVIKRLQNALTWIQANVNT